MLHYSSNVQCRRTSAGRRTSRLAVDWLPATTDLRAFLNATLAEYMIPSAFVPLDSIPLTAAGKVDRAALPPLLPSRPALNTAFVAPRWSTEERLATIWSEILGIDQIGVHDDFFDLGGHSLAATRIVVQVVKVFQVNVSYQCSL